MNKFHIELYPKADLENEWAKKQTHARRHALYALRRPYAGISCRERFEPCAECLCVKADLI